MSYKVWIDIEHIDEGTGEADDSAADPACVGTFDTEAEAHAFARTLGWTPLNEDRHGGAAMTEDIAYPPVAIGRESELTASNIAPEPDWTDEWAVAMDECQEWGPVITLMDGGREVSVTPTLEELREMRDLLTAVIDDTTLQRAAWLARHPGAKVARHPGAKVGGGT